MIVVTETYVRSSTQTHLWQRTYTRQFRAVTNNATIGPLAVREALPVSIGNSFVSRGDIDKGSFCQEITVTCTDTDGKQWDATATYGPYDAANQPQNPTLRPLKITWSSTVREKVLVADSDGNAVLNSAGDPFDPPVVVDEYYPVVTIGRAEMTNDPALNFKYRSAINSDVFLGADPGTVKCVPIEAELAFDQDIGWYYNKTYRFEFDQGGWNKGSLDQGLRSLAGGIVSPIFAKGVAITEPALLDGSGKALPVSGAPVFLDFKRYASLPFAIFNITLDMFPSNTPA